MKKVLLGLIMATIVVYASVYFIFPIIRGYIDSPINDYLKQREIGEYNKAIEILEVQMKDNPNDFQVLANLGIEYFRSNQFEKARDIWKKALKIKPDDNLEYLLSLVNKDYMEISAEDLYGFFSPTKISFDGKDNLNKMSGWLKSGLKFNKYLSLAFFVSLITLLAVNFTHFVSRKKHHKENPETHPLHSIKRITSISFWTVVILKLVVLIFTFITILYSSFKLSHFIRNVFTAPETLYQFITADTLFVAIFCTIMLFQLLRLRKKTN